MQGKELDYMAISSRSRSKRFSGSISMEIVTEVRDEWQNQEGSREKTSETAERASCWLWSRRDEQTWGPANSE